MGTKQYPIKENLYRLPWTMNDNPHGWTEITDVCNIHCNGCYRRMKGDGHKPFEQIKEEILFLKRWTNCDSIILAGGEAILHPQILEIIGFIKKNGMKSLRKAFLIFYLIGIESWIYRIGFVVQGY